TVAFVESHQAIVRARVALSREYAATARSLIESDPALAVVVAQFAEDAKVTTEATAALRSALAAAYPFVAIPSHGAAVTDAAVNDDGNVVATGSTDGSVHIWQ